MGFFDRFTDERFRQLADGRTIFLPKGADGPAYLVPEDGTRERLERRLKATGLVAMVMAVALGKFLYFRGTFHWRLLLMIPVIVFVKWSVAAHAAEQLQEIHDTRLFEQGPEPIPADDSGWQSWALVVGASIAAAAGVAMFVSHSAIWVQWAGFIIAAVSAWFVLLAFQDIRRSREIHRQHADRTLYGRTHQWPGKSGTRRRFS
jgi:hypothetical protein